MVYVNDDGSITSNAAPRYRLVGYSIGTEPDANGGWVHWTDYARLEAEIASLRTEVSRWKKMADRLAVALKETSDAHMSLAHDSYDGCWTIEDFDSESAVATEALAAHAAMKGGR